MKSYQRNAKKLERFLAGDHRGGPVDMFVAEFTPKLAERCLDYNTHNRKRSEDVTSSYRKDFQTGNWRLTGDTIKFTNESPPRLIDGQHRLQAVVDSKEPQDIGVAINVEPDAMDVLDIGRKRTLANALSLHSISHATICASAVRALGRMMTNDTHNKLTHAEAQELFFQHPKLQSSAQAVSNIEGVPKGILAAIHYIATDKLGMIAEAESFVHSLRYGLSAYPDDPAPKLKNQLLMLRVKGKRPRQKYIEWAAIYVWNKHSKGIPVKVFRFPHKQVHIDGFDFDSL